MADERMRVNDTILRYADTKSPEEISKLLGGLVSPARVAATAKELLKSSDWLTEAEQENLAFHKLKALLADLEGQYQTLDEKKLKLQVLKTVFDRWDKRRGATDEQLHTYNANVGRILGRVVDLSLAYMKGALRDEVDPARWDELVLEALHEARTEIAKHEIEAIAA